MLKFAIGALALTALTAVAVPRERVSVMWSEFQTLAAKASEERPQRCAEARDQIACLTDFLAFENRMTAAGESHVDAVLEAELDRWTITHWWRLKRMESAIDEGRLDLSRLRSKYAS